jgi:hypothetical protein
MWFSDSLCLQQLGVCERQVTGASSCGVGEHALPRSYFFTGEIKLSVISLVMSGLWVDV